MIDQFVSGYLFVMLAVAWMSMITILLSYKFEYQEVIAFPALLGVASFLYVMAMGGYYHLEVFLSVENRDLYYGLIFVVAALLKVLISCSLTEWYRRELKYVAYTIWSDIEVKSVERELDAMVSNVIEQFTWIAGMYAANSRCLFRGREMSSQVKSLMYNKEYDKAFVIMAEHVEVFLLDKFTDVYRDNFQVMAQFGSVAENKSMLKVRVGESDLIAKFLTEKSTALKALCFRGSIYQDSDLEKLIESNMKEESVMRLAKQLSDLYFYKFENELEPSYSLD
ncbi:hypothetical protein [Vibrio owensii]|uniref:hypothetical protein n=1 Tax=Vibrio owensii TaxID=696485 RepID=UPI001A7E9E5E|nr:hypothetical protein [Vibrio owensii]